MMVWVRVGSSIVYLSSCSSLFNQLQGNVFDNFWTTLVDFSQRIFTIPIPPPGSLKIVSLQCVGGRCVCVCVCVSLWLYNIIVVGYVYICVGVPLACTIIIFIAMWLNIERTQKVVLTL